MNATHDPAAPVTPTGDVLYGITMAYVGLVEELAAQGALDRGLLIGRLAQYAKLAKAADRPATPLAGLWLDDVRALLEAEAPPRG